MQKSRTILFVVAFLIFCALGGMIILDITLLPKMKLQPTTIVSQPTPYHQQNLALLHVDDLTSPTPSLISVWVVFMLPGTPPGVIFKPLYPQFTNAASTPPSSLPSDLGALFSLNPDGFPSEPFWQGVSQYDVGVTGMVMVDNEAYTSLVQWVTNTPVEFQPIIPISPETSAFVLAQEKTAFQNLCGALTMPPEQRSFKPEWKNLIPTHMRTDFSFDDLIVIWDTITTSPVAPICEIIPTP